MNARRWLFPSITRFWVRWTLCICNSNSMLAWSGEVWLLWYSFSEFLYNSGSKCLSPFPPYPPARKISYASKLDYTKAYYGIFGQRLHSIVLKFPYSLDVGAGLQKWHQQRTHLQVTKNHIVKSPVGPKSGFLPISTVPHKSPSQYFGSTLQAGALIDTITKSR